MYRISAEDTASVKAIFPGLVQRWAQGKHSTHGEWGVSAYSMFNKCLLNEWMRGRQDSSPRCL